MWTGRPAGTEIGLPDALSSSDHLRPSIISYTVSLAELREERMETRGDENSWRPVRTKRRMRETSRQKRWNVIPLPLDGLSSALLTWKCQAVSFTHTGAFKWTTNEVFSSIQRLCGSHAAKHCLHIGLALTSKRRGGRVRWPWQNDRSK